jgi:DNA-binding transcriptional regulator YiaG
MKSDEFRKIRVKFDMNQEQFASFLGLSGPNAVSNIETGLRNPSKFTAIILSVLDSLPKRKAEELIELIQVHGKKNK